MQQKKLLSALVGVSILAGGQVMATDVYELNPVIVTAQRIERQELETPATVSVVTEKEIKTSASRSTYDAISRVIGISTYSYADGYGSTGSSVGRVYLRGLDKGTLVMVNGTPLNQMNYGSPEAIPESAIERVEVVKGSNSVLYGAEAMGGVINIITKDPQKSVDTKFTVTGAVGDQEKNYGISAVGNGFIFSYQKKHIDPYWDAQLPYMHKKDKATKKVVPFVDNSTKRKMENVFASLKISNRLVFNWAHHKSLSGTRFKTLDEQGNWTGAWGNERHQAGYDYEEIRDNVGFQYDDQKGFKANLAYNTKRTTGFRWLSDWTAEPMGSSSNYRVNNYYLDAQKEMVVGEGDLIVGAMAYREEYKEIRQGTGNEIGRNQFAVFGSYEWNPAERLTVIGGVRLHFSQDNGWDDDQHVFLPQIQTSYMIRPDLSWYVNVGRSFEMPAINNKYARGNAIPWSISPQKGWTYETGLKWISDRHTIKAAAFYMDIDNMFGWEKIKNAVDGWENMGLDGDSNIQVNRGEFKNKGVEVEYRQFTNDNFDWFVGMTYQDPKVRKTASDPWEQQEAKVQAKFGFNYSKDKWLFSLDGFIEADRQDNKRKIDYGSDHLPSRFSLNSNLRYQYTENTSFDLAVRNILDKENYTGLYMWKERPRSVLFSVSHTF